MANRTFKLPGEEDLNKDQDRVLALPENGQYLVVGGPGTGKSVVALLRALKYQQNGNHLFLVYNKVLESASGQLITSKLKYLRLTQFLYKMYWSKFKEETPELEKFKPDYDLIIGKLEELTFIPNPQHLIIDEAQDMPPKFYEALMVAGYEHFFIVADQNQPLTEDNSTRKELAELLDLEQNEVIELKANYRNTRPIAVFANHFYTDPASPPPDLPEKGSIDTPVLYENLNIDDCCRFILKEADKDTRNLIGVIVADNKRRERYLDKLGKIEIDLDNPKPILASYASKGQSTPEIDFSQGGVAVLNLMSVKGLEFDIVFIILDGFRVFDAESMKKRFYVMSSRAIKKLYLFSETPLNSGVDQLLPGNPNILKRITNNHKN
jgi:hypothetical protein